MGIRKQKYDKIEESFKFTENFIQRALSNHYFSPNSVKYDIDNLFVFKDWESDKVLITKSGYIYEFEIKVSKSDFKNDFKHKEEKYKNFNLVMEGEELTDKCFPNYFSYACPKGLIQTEDIPDYAGLVYVDELGWLKIVKMPKRIHKSKLSEEQLGLAEKFYYNMINWKNKANETKQILKEEMGLREEKKKVPYATLKQAYEDMKEHVIRLTKENEYLTKSEKENAKYYRILERKVEEKIKQFDSSFEISTILKETDEDFFNG